MIKEQLNIELTGADQRPFLADLLLPSQQKNNPVLIFVHGFKGFKDWGPFPLITSYFAERGFASCKFNFSHNGTTVDDPVNFADLEAFGQNNFSKELYDLEVLIDWLTSKDQAEKFGLDINRIYLMGHSRGGGVAILKASEDSRIKKLVTMASVSNLERSFSNEVLDDWKKTGVQYIMNGRTNQNMPLYFQLYENFKENFDRLNIPTRSKTLQIPTLIVHGEKDPTVPVASARALHQWIPNAELLEIENGDHVFGGKHPWIENHLPENLNKVCMGVEKFLK